MSKNSGYNSADELGDIFGGKEDADITPTAPTPAGKKRSSNTLYSDNEEEILSRKRRTETDSKKFFESGFCCLVVIRECSTCYSSRFLLVKFFCKVF